MPIVEVLRPVWVYPLFTGWGQDWGIEQLAGMYTRGDDRRTAIVLYIIFNVNTVARPVNTRATFVSSCDCNRRQYIVYILAYYIIVVLAYATLVNIIIMVNFDSKPNRGSHRITACLYGAVRRVLYADAWPLPAPAARHACWPALCDAHRSQTLAIAD